MKKTLTIFFISCLTFNSFAVNPGLINLSFSDCYFNSLIQCLSHLEYLNNFLDRVQPRLPTDNPLNKYLSVIYDMKQVVPGTVFGDHIRFIRTCEKIFHADNVISIINGLFKNTPPALKEEMLNFAFVKEERTYNISSLERINYDLPEEEIKYKWTSKFTFGNYPQMNALTDIEWGSAENTRTFISRNKFTKSGDTGYLANASKNYNLKSNFVQNVYSKEVQLDLTKIKNEIREKIKNTYKTQSPKGFIFLRKYPEGCTEDDIEYDSKIQVFIDDLKNEQFWQTLGISPEEAIKFFTLSNGTRITVNRKLIPPIILIIPAQNKINCKRNFKFNQNLLVEGIETAEIGYVLKAILVGSEPLTTRGGGIYSHAWAYAIENDGTWIEYDDNKVKKLISRDTPTKFNSLSTNFSIKNPPGAPLLLFFELDQESKRAVDNYYQ